MSDSQHDVIETLLDDFITRLRNGEKPSIAHYEAAHPECASEIRRTFPSVQMIEQAAQLREQKRPSAAVNRRPEHIGDFRITREIGRGGMGVVYEAEQVSLGRRVAVKVLPKHLLLEPRQVQRFEREARTAAKLHHTNIVPIFGVGADEGYHYYVMQLIDGVGLDRALAQLPDGESEIPILPGFGKMNECDYWLAVASIGVQVSDAVAYAHAQGTLHRDVKPANLLLDKQGVVWVTDFGLAKAVEQGSVSQTGSVVGTLRYMAPEQLNCQADARSDIYSLGLTLYELLALRPAYDATSTNNLIRKISQTEATRLRNINPRIPRDLETIISKAVAHDPEERYQSAFELRDDLNRFLEDLPIQARRARPVELLWRWSRRNPAVASWAGLSAVLLVAVAVVAAIGFARTSSQRAKAEANSELAQQALDDIFEQFVPDRVGATLGITSVGDEGEIIDVAGQPVLSKEAAALLQRMLPFYDRLAEQDGDDLVLLRKAADANRRMGDIHQRLGNFEKAIAAYGHAVNRYLELRDGAPGDGSLGVEIAGLHNRLGTAYWAMGQVERGQICHREALATLEAAPAFGSGSAEHRYELARTFYALSRRPGRESGPGPKEPPPGGNRPPPRGPDDSTISRPRTVSGRSDAGIDRAQRENSIRKGVAALEELVSDYPATPDYRYLLALCYRELPPQRTGGGENLVPEYVERATQILKTLSEDFPNVPEYRYELCETYAMSHLRGQTFTPEMHQATEQRLRRALGIAEALVAEHPNIPDYITSEIHIHHKLAHVVRQTRRPTEAEENLRKALILQKSLVQRFPNVASYRAWTAVVQESLAKLLCDRGELAEARSTLEQSVTTLNELLRQDPNTAHVHGLLARSHESLADVLTRLGEHGQASEARTKAEEHRLEG